MPIGPVRWVFMEPTSPQQTPTPRPTDGDDEAQREYVRNIGFFSLTLIGSWIVQLFPFPVSLVAGLLGLVGGFFLFRAVRAGLRTPRKGMVIAVAVLGVLVIAFLVGATVFGVIFYDTLNEQTQCLQGAITEQARTACADPATLLERMAG